MGISKCLKRKKGDYLLNISDNKSYPLTSRPGAAQNIRALAGIEPGVICKQGTNHNTVPILQ